MMKILFIGFLMLLSLCSVKPKELSGKLIFSHIIYRHGDRTAIDLYPTDPWRDRKYWSAAPGQLTNIGKMQHYKLGKWLRNRYRTLLNETYSKDEIRVRSTDVDRTLMSALSNLAGLYEPQASDMWNDKIPWQPIPVHTTPEQDDYVLAGKKYCAKYNYEMNKLRSSPAFQKLDQKYAYLYKYLTEHSGQAINSFEAVQSINNTFFIEQLYNRTLPKWTEKVYPNGDMPYITNLCFAIPTYNKKLARLKIGPLLKDIFDRFKNKTKSKSKVKQSVWMYSAHDTTIGSVLNGLGLFDLHSPPYAACILFELRIDHDNTPLISIFYKNTTQTPKPFFIPKCGVQCPLDQMYKLYGDILPNNWEDECNQSPSWLLAYNDYSPEQGKSLLFIFFALFGSVAVIMALIYFVSLHHRRRNYVNYRCYVQ